MIHAEEYKKVVDLFDRFIDIPITTTSPSPPPPPPLRHPSVGDGTLPLPATMPVATVVPPAAVSAAIASPSTPASSETDNASTEVMVGHAVRIIQDYNGNQPQVDKSGLLGGNAPPITPGRATTAAPPSSLGQESVPREVHEGHDHAHSADSSAKSSNGGAKPASWAETMR